MKRGKFSHLRTFECSHLQCVSSTILVLQRYSVSCVTVNICRLWSHISLYSAIPQLTCRTCASVWLSLLKESTAVTCVCRHTFCSIIWTVLLQCTDKWKRTNLWVKQSYRKNVPTWQRGIPCRQNKPFKKKNSLFFPSPALPCEAIESCNACGVIDHLQNVWHYRCTSVELPVSTTATEIVLQ